MTEDKAPPSGWSWERLIKLSPKYLFAIALATGFLRYVPDQWISQAGLTAFRDRWRTELAVIFWLSFAFWLSHGLASASRWVRMRWTLHEEHVKLARVLRETSKPEREILARYVAEDTTTLNLSTDDGLVNGLVGKRVLYHGAAYAKSTVGSDFMMDINMQPWAWRYLRKYPKLLREEVQEARHNLRKSKRRERLA